NLAAPITGRAARFALDGQVRMGPGEDVGGQFNLTRRDADGHYGLNGRYTGQDVEARLVIAEPAGGFLAYWAGLPDVGALAGEASLRGPLSAVESRIMLTAHPLPAARATQPPPQQAPSMKSGGQDSRALAASRAPAPASKASSQATSAAPAGAMRLEGQGRVDFLGESADIHLELAASAMQPAPDLAWRGLTLHADLRGPWSSPQGKITGRLDQLRGHAWSLREVRLDATGEPDRFAWTVDVLDARRPDASADLLLGQPLRLWGQLRPEGKDRAVSFELRHPDLNGRGDARWTDAGYTLHTGLMLPNLKLLSAMSGLGLAGASELKLEAAESRGETQLTVEGQLGLATGLAPLPELIGPAATLRATARFNPGGFALESLRVQGRNLSVEGQARLTDGRWAGQAHMSVPQLAGLHAELRGRTTVQARFEGPPGDFGATLNVEGEVGSARFKPTPVQAQLRLQELPEKPVGELTAQGRLAGAPLELRARLENAGDIPGLLIEQAGWKTLKARGRLRLEPDRALPSGLIEFDWPRLEDVQPLTGQRVSGGVSGRFDFGQPGHPDRIGVGLQARQAGLGDAWSGASLKLNGELDGWPQAPTLWATLAAQDLNLGGIAVAEGRLEARGPLSALDLKLQARAPQWRGDDLTLEAEAHAESENQSLRLERLAAGWRGEQLRLLAPVSLDFRQGLSLGELRLGLRESRLEAAGMLSPALDFNLNLKVQPGDLAAIALGGMPLSGRLEATARLTGTPRQPGGRLLVEAIKLHAAAGPPAGLPPLNARLAADLLGEQAHIDSRLDLGPRVNLQLLGEAPTQAEGSLDLRATGRADLAVLDPWLSATGQRLHGQINLDTRLQAAGDKPRVSGTLRLAHGEAQDYAQGINLSRIEGVLEAGEDGRLRLRRMEAQAGPGTVRATGEVDLNGPERPVNLILTARNAQPLASDRLTANVDTDLLIRGPLAGPLTLSGPIRILRAEIRIPENMPAHIAVLKVRRPGEIPPAPAPDKPGLLLDLQIDASRQIFVRGRGIDAELDGSIRVKGVAGKPETLGHFNLRRGQLNLAGQTLNFSKGEIGFTGGKLNDPTLDFEATANRGGTRTILNVGGSARKPVIALSSVPALPEDEVLSQLLFGKSATSLSPFEMARIAGALVSLTGATSGLVNPLEKIRHGLGLDRLTIGSDRTGNPTLEAGRYVMPGVYLGAKQGTSGGGTPQSVIQVDITDNLKVEGTIGAGSATGSTGNAQSAGVVYQFEY
ncbi:MAG: translocation/assembly module TamB domain-containing protein, partial [Methylococcus sp.]